jgi:dihydropteroate synthase/2-amino-4-hydroxy-6-hydroxymethyldihydropteridine diphosphokinase
MTANSHIVYLGLGTNSGDRHANLLSAAALLPPKVTVLTQSPIYQTPPWGYTEQADFLNQVIKAETTLTPLELLKYVKEIEEKVGRTATFRWGPREIDIDILFYDDLIFEDKKLTIPHPYLHQRNFVLVPLADLSPDLLHPLTGLTVRQHLAELDPSSVTKFDPEQEKLVADNQPLTINNKTFAWGSRTFVMGIINLTPDSFSGDGLNSATDPVKAAVDQAARFIEAGVDILDLGGESTRPGSEPVGAEEETQRVLPVIEALVGEYDITISIDTYKASVAAKALDAGAHIINDVWGLRADPELGRVAAEKNAPVILMHNRSTPKSADVQQRLGGRYIGMKYDDLIEDIMTELMESVELARQAGIPDEHIILDTGIGFGKTVEQNLELLNRGDEISDLGYPLLIGPSRKSFIGFTLDLPPGQRVEGTAAAISVAIVRGADIVRVHDVETMVRVARMTDAIVR